MNNMRKCFFHRERGIRIGDATVIHSTSIQFTGTKYRTGGKLKST